MSVIKIDNSAPSSATNHCRLLEQGNILFFDNIPFDLPGDDIEFLLSTRQTSTRLHKNISYRPGQDVIRGAAANAKEVNERVRAIMRNYSTSVQKFLATFLTPYAST